MSNKIQVAMKLYRFGAPGFCYMDLVQGMFRQLDFINKICPHFEYWMHLKLQSIDMNKPRSVKLVPKSDIDLVWHSHQTDHKENIMPTKQVINHDDTIEGGDLSKGYADTFVLWFKKFGVAYSSFPPNYEVWVKGKSDDILTQLYFRQRWAKYANLPNYGVNEAYPVEAIPYANATSEANTNNPNDAKCELPLYVTVIGAYRSLEIRLSSTMVVCHTTTCPISTIVDVVGLVTIGQLRAVV
ncbi:hypothetical protein THRCLA_07149 [Thraustotheca clavata]|uniref:Uncharacterized protein n=1 Tax=Thraustotheca clavata TaxID=74557 RepID=A0A1V9ZFV2_9STRA|nr:hypothetical protein THRCLA_07149 [Thraustotheca clavata]